MSKIYAIKDQAIEAFSQPFFVQAQGQAVRMFMDETKNEQSQINRHPADFELWYIGEFDEQTGTVTAAPNVERVARATDFINKE